MSYYDDNDEELIFSSVFKTESDAYFEYLLAQDQRDIPAKKQKATRNFIIQISILALVVILASLVEEYRQAIFYMTFGAVAVAILLVYFSNGLFYHGDEKFIRKLQQEGVKKNKNVTLHVRLEIYKDMIYLENGPERFTIRPVDIDEWYETEHMLIVRIRQLKSTPCKELEKIVIPKEVLGDKITAVEDTLSRMILIGDKVLVKMKEKK